MRHPIWHIRNIWSWITTIPFLICFGLTLVVFHPIHICAHLLHPKALRATLVTMNWLILLWLRVWNGARFKVSGTEHLPHNAPCIIISNHESMFDIPLFIWFARAAHPQFIAKKELRRHIPSISFLLRHMGSLLIDRSDRTGSIDQIKSFGAKANKGPTTVVIFPEGTRARDGKMLRFRSGGTLALMEAMPDAILIPVAISDSHRLVLHHLFPVPWGLEIHFKVGAPVDRSKSPPRATLAAIETTIRELQSNTHLP